MPEEIQGIFLEASNKSFKECGDEYKSLKAGISAVKNEGYRVVKDSGSKVWKKVKESEQVTYGRSKPEDDVPGYKKFDLRI